MSFEVKWRILFPEDGGNFFKSRLSSHCTVKWPKLLLKTLQFLTFFCRKIFAHLDNETAFRCREVCSSWKDFVEENLLFSSKELLQIRDDLKQMHHEFKGAVEIYHAPFINWLPLMNEVLSKGKSYQNFLWIFLNFQKNRVRSWLWNCASQILDVWVHVQEWKWTGKHSKIRL